MRFLTVLLAVLTFSICPSFAVDPPATPPVTPPGSAATAPAPAPPVNPPVTPPSGEARKEEEAEKARAGLLARLRAHVKGTSAMADDLATIQKANADLQARIKTLEDGTELKALRDENAAMRADIQAYIEHAQTHGLQPESGTRPAPPAPQSPMGKAAGQAVAGAVGNQLANLGVPVTQLPAAGGQDGPAATLAEVEQQLKACKSDRERQAILAKHRKIIMSSN